MTIDPKIFKAYDIRAVYPTEINEENIVPIIRAIYSFFKEDLKKQTITIALGRDMRVSSPSLFQIAKDTLLKVGAHIVDVGLVSTPTFYFAVSHYGYDCGIQITASHNPKEYNGVKFVKNSPHGLIKIGKSTGMEKVMDLSIKGVMLEEKEGMFEENSHVQVDEVQNALSLFNNPVLDTFTIVADPANAMGITYIEELFQHIPGNLVRMNFTLDGTFPSHQPDPLNFDNLKDLQKKVIETKANIGLAPDGDGDRLFFIDEKGQVIPASIITALIAREFLKTNPGALILFDIRYVLTPSKIVEENNGRSLVTKIGHAYITEALTGSGGLFSGESSAHYFYKASGNAESQVITILTVLKVLSEEKKPLSEIVEELRRSYESGEINFTVGNAQEIMNVVTEKYKDGSLDALDGVSISYPQWRVNLRISNTEPLLRLNF